jgi:hypothetical protein
MAKTIMAVFSNPASPDVEGEYNAWYDSVHLKELTALPGISRATRYRVSDSVDAVDHRYVALYELDEPVEAVLAQLGTLPGDVSPALDAAGSRVLFWEPVP